MLAEVDLDIVAVVLDLVLDVAVAVDPVVAPDDDLVLAVLEVGYDVLALVEDEGVEALAAGQDIVALAAGEVVVAVAAGDPVVAVAALDDVVAVAAVESCLIRYLRP